MPSITGEPGAVGLPRELHSVQDIGVVAGPAVGAGILAVTSPATAFGVNAIELPAGMETGRHFHDEQQELYFVHRGRIEMTFNDGDSHVLGPGGVGHEMDQRSTDRLAIQLASEV